MWVSNVTRVRTHYADLRSRICLQTFKREILDSRPLWRMSRLPVCSLEYHARWLSWIKPTLSWLILFPRAIQAIVSYCINCWHRDNVLWYFIDYSRPSIHCGLTPGSRGCMSLPEVKESSNECTTLEGIYIKANIFFQQFLEVLIFGI